MSIKSEQRLARQVPSVLASLLDVPVRQVKSSVLHGDAEADLVVQAAGQTFLVEVLASARPGQVAAHALHVVNAARKLRRQAIPVLAVPYMHETGRRACEAARVAWFDLSGNARIVTSGIRIIVDGRPDQFRRPGRPSSVFAPKSARIVRWLLMHPERVVTQRELARATGMAEGFVSRIVARLESDHYLVRVDSYVETSGSASDRQDARARTVAKAGSVVASRGRPPVRVRDASLLLDAWREEYQFGRHTILRGHVAARSGDALAREVGERLIADQVEHAATGLAAAWQMTRFAAFRIATFFVAKTPTADWKARLGFREDPRGGNLWLVTPNDAGVFQGVHDQDGLRCVHPVQAFVDLKEHPERAVEAAERLRAQYMNWRPDA